MRVSLTNEQRARLHNAEAYWLATVKAEPAAHLVPLWGVLVGDAIYMGTEPRSQKVHNILAHPRAALALPDARRVLILEGTVSLLSGPAPVAVMERFQDKYEWTFHPEEGKWVLIQFVPEKVLSWNSDES